MTAQDVDAIGMDVDLEVDVVQETGAGSPATGEDVYPQVSPGGRVRGRGRDRVHSTPRRRKALLLRYTDEEYLDVATAARMAGLTATGFVAEAALAAARKLEGPSIAPLRAALVEVMAARTQVRRFAVNVNQAVAQLHAKGEPPPWLADAVRLTSAAVARLDETAQQLVGATRSQRASGTRRPSRPAPDQEPTAREGQVATNTSSAGGAPDARSAEGQR